MEGGFSYAGPKAPGNLGYGRDGPMAEAPHVASNRIAAEAATTMMKQGFVAKLSIGELAVTCETTLAIIVVAAAEQSLCQDKPRFAQEMIETITERAHNRAQAMLRGVPFRE